MEQTRTVHFERERANMAAQGKLKKEKNAENSSTLCLLTQNEMIVEPRGSEAVPVN